MNVSHSRVGAYLDDLARMLSDIDPAERDDILASVREHLDAEIGSGDGGDAVVHAALLRLGPPEQVAAEARAGQPPRTTHVPQPPAAAPFGTPRPHHPKRTRIAATICLVVVGIPAVAALAGRIALVVHPDGGPASIALLPHPAEVLILLPLLFPIWLVALVVTLGHRELTARTMVALAALGPTTSVLVFAEAIWRDPMVLSTTLSLVGLPAVLVGIVVTARRLWRETHS